MRNHGMAQKYSRRDMDGFANVRCSGAIGDGCDHLSNCLAGYGFSHTLALYCRQIRETEVCPIGDFRPLRYRNSQNLRDRAKLTISQ